MKESVLNEISYKSETVHVRLSKQESDILNKLSKKHNTSQNNIVGMLVRVSNNDDKFNVSNDFLRLNNEKFKYDKINSKKEIIRNFKLRPNEFKALNELVTRYNKTKSVIIRSLINDFHNGP